MPDSPASGPPHDEWAQIAAAQRDPAAFGPLYEDNVDLIWRFTCARLGDPERAADATSLTFQRALTGLATFRPQRTATGTTTFRPWLLRIARNVVIDEVRRQRPTHSLDDEPAGHWLVAPGRSPEDEAVASDERRRVLAALDRLSETPRQIVEFRLWGLSVAEIAALLDMSESAVKTAHHRAYRRLRDLLTEPTGEDLP
jgi:RNA polymerase sigma-70 factor (ECF subfamily)